jgi:hypothetical protein
MPAPHSELASLQHTPQPFDLTVRLEQLMLERETGSEAVAQRVLAELEHATGDNVDTVAVRVGCVGHALTDDTASRWVAACCRASAWLDAPCRSDVNAASPCARARYACPT